ncbi:hypothetical protein J7552_09530 [Wohlfahrtiimonas chitiniclastica]|uniref:hypothetical protein n=1 Tax=Wohlfahrtiimonas chitiniclastica TaxID=400946 RepID=UPI001BD05038|nr:hypothetical protein [Wohlfahrtiimonas chitiniclastica]MBS7821518.1 hypothetical protein [Wohlfahrtiimonas chitiniclastica]
MKKFFIGLRLKLHNEYTEFRVLDKYSQLLLGSYLIYSLIAILYITTTKNYYELWLMVIVPLCSLPLLFSFLPEARKYKHIDKFFRDLYEQNQEVSFFYLVGLFAITWLGFLWGTDIITLDYDRRITLSVQSFTASLAPLAFYIAYKNYARKSGFNIIVRIKEESSFVYPTYVKKITLINEKDRAYAILGMHLILNKQIIIKLKHNIDLKEANESVLKSYDISTFTFPPYSLYTVHQSPASIALKEFGTYQSLLKGTKQLCIETTQGFYYSPDFTSFNDNIVLKNKAAQPTVPIYLMGSNHYGKIVVNKKNYKIILPAKFITIITLIDKQENVWIVLFERQNQTEGTVLKATLDINNNVYIIDNKTYKSPDHPIILDDTKRITKQDRLNKNSFLKYQKKHDKQLHDLTYSDLLYSSYNTSLLVPDIFYNNIEMLNVLLE